MVPRRNRALFVALLAVFALFLCAVAAGIYWGTGPSLQCGSVSRGPAQPGWSSRRVISGARARCYHLYVPSGYDPAQLAPVVLSLHGFLSNPESHAWISGWHDLADKEGFLVVYPQGTSYPQRWNAGATWGAARVDDVQFFRDLLDDLSSVAALDRSRVYVNGFSNGGGMTVRIGCEAADLVAAIGSVAGAVVDLEHCDRTRPLPLMAFHGIADPLVPYEGGEMRGHLLPWGADLTDAPTYFVGAEEWVAIWAAGNGCDPTPEAIPPQGDVSGLHYSGCDGGSDVIFFSIEGGGHSWPGGPSIPLLGKTSTDIDATEQMWDFYQTYHLDE